MVALAVLLVEDNEFIRDHLCTELRRLPAAQVVGSADAEDQAIQWLGTHAGQWNLAVVDLVLKRGHGLGVVRHAGDRLPRQKVAVLTNYVTEQTRDECLRAGADRVFDKSFELEQFFDYCRQIVLERADRIDGGAGLAMAGFSRPDIARV